MSADKPIPEALADAIANTAAAAIFALKKEMEARGEVMKYNHVKDAIRDAALAVITPNLPKIIGAKSDAEVIYAAYPIKVGKIAALKAIAVALRSMPAADLLAKVQAYAAAVAKWPHALRYSDGRDTVPHPRTWFNQGRFLDDPATWARSAAASSETPAKQPLMR
jgi:hypothetical protein